MTSSPGENSVTAGPTRSTTPATSQQGTSGKWLGKRASSPPRTDFQSTGLTPTAFVRTRTVSGPTIGSGTSVSRRTSLPPKRSVAKARMAPSDHGHGAVTHWTPTLIGNPRRLHAVAASWVAAALASRSPPSAAESIRRAGDTTVASAAPS